MNAVDSVPVDAAWVAIDTPLAAAQLAAFCRDVERLYRINPYLEFRHWRAAAGGRYDASWRNTSNSRDVELELTVECRGERAFTVRYDRGLKRSTQFRIEESSTGSRLIVTDDYSGSAREVTDTAEVDKSLHAWGVALRDYLRREARWGRYALWRWYMRRVWMPMKPAARRITFLLLAVTAGELAVIALVMAIYWAESAR
jgi:hypothetical protein